MVYSRILRFLYLWIPVIIWGSLIFYLSSIPGLSTNLGVIDIILRKGAHVFEFTVLYLFLLRALKSNYIINPKKTVIIGLILTILYAFSDELHQYFVINRTASLIDVLIDITLPIIITYRIMRY